MATAFKTVISRVDGPLFDGDVVSITCPGREGEVTIMAGHEPFITVLKKGTITVRPHNSDATTFPVEQGILEVTPDAATVLL